jgi:hypothetical protein
MMYTNRSNLTHRLSQAQFDWVSNDLFASCESRLHRRFDNRVLTMEVPIERQIGDTLVSGQLDAVDDLDQVWEFKYTERLDMNHVMQVALYMYLTNMRYKAYFLMNIATGEVWRICSSLDQLERWILKLQTETQSIQSWTDEQFIHYALKGGQLQHCFSSDGSFF